MFVWLKTTFKLAKCGKVRVARSAQITYFIPELCWHRRLCLARPPNGYFCERNLGNNALTGRLPVIGIYADAQHNTESHIHIEYICPFMLLKSDTKYKSLMSKFSIESSCLFKFTIALSACYESFTDVGEIRVWFASKILTPCRMHWNAFLIAKIIAKCHSFPNMYGML